MKLTARNNRTIYNEGNAIHSPTPLGQGDKQRHNSFGSTYLRSFIIRWRLAKFSSKVAFVVASLLIAIFQSQLTVQESVDHHHQQYIHQHSQQEEEDSNRYLPEQPVEVVVWPFNDLPSEFVHIYRDGIEKSPFLRFSHNMSSFLPENDPSRSIETVWLGLANVGDLDAENGYSATQAPNTTSTSTETSAYDDDGYANRWCEYYQKAVLEARENCQRQGRPRENCYWHIYILEYADWPEEDMDCPQVEDAMTIYDKTNATILVDGKDYVHYGRRSVVYHRTWDSEEEWIEPGEILSDYNERQQDFEVNHSVVPNNLRRRTPPPIVTFPSINMTSDNLFRYRQFNYPVRSDVIEQVESVLKQNNIFDIKSKNNKGVSLPPFSLSDSIESLWNRPIDIAHFWPVGERDQTSHSRFRWKVSSLLIQYCASNISARAKDGQPPIACFVGKAGSLGEAGRRDVSNSYVETMLQTKIIVVTQRDYWEDHYRLMEAVVTGAMIIMDAMLTLPNGFVDGVHIVEYRSSRDLLDKMAYYLDPSHEAERLDIARSGRKLAMDRHRSWHRMEEIIFGRVLTTPEMMPW